MSYAVVGCSDCNALWVVAGRPETTSCPRCETRHQFGTLKQFVTTDDEDHAREVRASILANKAGYGEAFADMDGFTALGADAMAAGIDDDDYLDAAGVDAAEAAAAGERAEGTRRSRSRQDTVRAALRELDEPTEREVAAFAAEHGVGSEYVADALAKLTRAGEVVDAGDGYRLL
ncbi:DUF5817 domain-containing protein [Halobacterium sp. BOL4-2]|uniref:DUF5817 domain-containing protein n=1 Tax=Halobacterium sp. BOL4-2 TaxID=2810537 RepID=UPI0019646A4B|nr:DUF5817 domain-containing protein [Halobacterium sp. BOL4-2]QRY24215.1 DUF5817 domain-containing protein [Halobacterium sp. BOL4-2]